VEIKVLLVDDHLVVLRGLRFFLNTQPDIEIVGETNNGKEALEKIGELNPDVILMDLMMPVMDGVEATRQIKAMAPDVKVIVLTSFSDQDHVLPAFRAGAVGYQLKDIEPDDLVKTIRAAYRGETLLHPAATNLLLSHVTTDGETKKNKLDLAELTRREKECCTKLPSGKVTQKYHPNCTSQKKR
jgi:DNA-binding NarL/FixJ family response regulator